MGIGTSDGQYYEDEFEAAVGQLYDQTEIMNKTPIASKNYDTPLNMMDEFSFQQWKMQNAPNDSGVDYDLRGAFKAGLTPAENGHWPDTYKKPNHPTFSNESIYAQDRPDLAGRWEGETYIPPSQTPNFSWVDEGNKVNKPPVTLKEVGQSALQDIGKFGQSLVDSLTMGPKLMEKVSKGEIDLNSEEGIKHVTDTAMSIGLTSLATAPLRPGVGLFGGRMSKDAVRLSEKLEVAGIDEKRIKQLTGIERGADGQWRKEISDKEAKVDWTKFDTAYSEKGQVHKLAELGQLLKHQAFFEAYPEAKKIVVYANPELDKLKYNGMYSSDTGVLHINPRLLDKPGEAKSTLIHELQHWIQHKEGFDLGHVDNIEKAVKESLKSDVLKKHYQGSFNEIKRLADQYRKETNPTTKQMIYEDAVETAKGILKDADNPLYVRLASEVEARNASRRMDMAWTQMRASPGKWTEDVKRGDQILINKKGKTTLGSRY
jgi:hypothetical protein